MDGVGVGVGPQGRDADLHGRLVRTVDPHVLIEEQRVGYVRYRCDDGRRWEVWGVCDHNRACLVGAVVGGVLVESVEQARALPIPELDCPVGPGFKGCCDLRIVERVPVGRPPEAR